MELIVQRRMSSDETLTALIPSVTPCQTPLQQPQQVEVVIIPPLPLPQPQPQVIISKKRRLTKPSNHKSEASSLEHETKGYLGARSRTTAYRTASYKPTLEKFKRVSFPNYVRRVLLGVEVEGVEGEDPYFSCSTDSEDEGEDGENVVVVSIPTPQSITDIPSTTAVVDNVANTSNNLEQPPLIDLTSCIPPTTSINNNGTPDRKVVDLQYCEVVSSGTNSTSSSSNSSGTSSSSSQSESDLHPPIIETLTSLPPPQSQPPPPQSHPQIPPKPKPPPRLMTTRSQTRSITINPSKTNSASNTMHGRIFPHPTTPPPPKRKRKVRPLPPRHCDELKLSDGIAKITPPVGWWDKAGIGKDTTGRGPTWQADGAMGGMTIPGPIKQCASGIGGVYDFTMMEIPAMTVDQFRVKADAYRKRQIGIDVDPKEGNRAMDDLARKFWRRLGPTMEPSIYGADMEGTLFDGATACGWNIDRLESCLQLLRADADDEPTDGPDRHFRLPGVTSAYLYFGMWASVFAAHTEDMNLPSINYLHAGAPKYWYAISPDDSDRFESLMASQFSCAASACPQFLRHKSHLISPSIITKAGISYTTQVQRAGDVIITFPGSYHFGFNTGFNCAESTNFAFPEWIPMGEKAKVCMCHPHSVRIDIQRFKALHDKYEFETSYEDGPSMTYDEWAKLEAKRVQQFSQKAHDNYIKNQHHSTQPTTNIPPPKTKNAPRKREKVVEVVKMLRHKKTGDLAIPTKRKPTNNTKNKPDKLDWRLAVHARKSAFGPRTKVLCNVKSNDLDDVFFSGVISCVVEDHARVHFAGSTKNEDIWIQTNSCKLYLDGGALESSSTQDKKKVVKKRVVKKAKKR